MWCRICCVDGSRLTTPQDFNLKLHEFVHYNTYVCVFLSIKIVPPAPSVKRVPGLVLGSKVHWLCLTDCQRYWWDLGAHTCSGRCSLSSCELLARAPGDCIALAHSACLVHRCPGLPGMRDHLVAVTKLCFVCVSY